MPVDALVYGHRGWSARFPDNCLAGVTAAARVADGVEVDVRRSGDGKLVLSHDEMLGGHPVAETPWPTLAAVDLGEGHKPALLDEALVALVSTPCLIEVKNNPHRPGFEPDHRLALEAAERARPGDMVTSFNWGSVRRVAEIYEDVGTGLVCLSDAVEEAIAVGLDGGHALAVERHTSSAALEEAVATGLQVLVWTVNDPGVAGELAGLGVSGIITDQPDLIREALGAARR